MKLKGIARTHFNEWRINVKKHSLDYTTHNSIIMTYLIEEWFNSVGIFFIPCPITGPKNGYDSFPIIGWRTDILITNKNTTNSYYMGYPYQDWFIMSNLEKGETLDDLNIDKSETIQNSKLLAIEEANKLYNKQYE